MTDKDRQIAELLAALKQAVRLMEGVLTDNQLDFQPTKQERPIRQQLFVIRAAITKAENPHASEAP